MKLLLSKTYIEDILASSIPRQTTSFINSFISLFQNIFAKNFYPKMSKILNNSYPLAALMIHAGNKEVTVEALEKVFKALNLEFSSKIASLFCLSAEKYNSMLISTSSAPSIAAGTTAATQAKVENLPEPAQESESSSIALEF